MNSLGVGKITSSSMDSEEKSIKHLLLFVAKHPSLQIRAILWVSLTLMFVAMINWIQWKQHEEKFFGEASKAFDAVYEKIQINEAILVGFASLLKTISEDDLSQVRKFTKEVREAYPHIYMLEAQTSVRWGDVAQFEHRMRALGYDDFKVKRFDYDGDRQWKERDKQPVYYPLHFIDPMGTPADEVLGLDALSVSFLKDALVKSIEQDRAVASSPFELFEGGQAYVLFKALDPKTADPENLDAGLVVSLLIKTRELLNYAADIAPGAEISLRHKSEAVYTLPATDRSHAYQHANITFGTFVFEKLLDDFGQPYHLRVVKKGTLTLYDLLVSLALFLGSCFGLILHLKHSFITHIRESERSQALGLLEEERNSLEQKVEQRTAALSRVNTHLNQQLKKNSLLAQRLMSVQEDEYKALSRELHDEFGQILTAINTNAHIINTQISTPPSISISAQQILDLSNTLHGSLKDVMKRLRPAALDTFGLKTAIEECVKTFHLDSQNISYHLEFDELANALDDDVSIAIYRIVQELVNNAIKHASPSKIGIDVRIHANEVHVRVSDDGIGLDLKKTPPSYGLMGVKERARSFGGSMTVIHNNALCTIEIIIPLTIRNNNEQRNTCAIGG